MFFMEEKFEGCSEQDSFDSWQLCFSAYQAYRWVIDYHHPPKHIINYSIYRKRIDLCAMQPFAEVPLQSPLSINAGDEEQSDSFGNPGPIQPPPTMEQHGIGVLEHYKYMVVY